MKVLTFDSEEEWRAARPGKIGGSRLGDVITKRGTAWKIGVFEVIAERIKQEVEGDDVDEIPMERGHRLEKEAIARFAKDTGKKVDDSLVMWVRDDEESIAVSPDGAIGKTGAVVVASTGTREAVEVKCLSCAKHIQAWVLQEVPDEYKDQVYQYFIVNEKLETLYFIFYDPRIPSKDFFYLTITRESVQGKVDEYLEYQKSLLEQINQIVNDLTF